MQRKQRRVDGTIHEKIVLTGYFHRGELISKLEPVKNWVLYTNTIYTHDKDGSQKYTPLVACTTNGYGALRPISKTFRGVPAAGLVRVHKMVLPPVEMIAHAAATFTSGKKNLDWKKEIGDAISKHSELETIDFQTQMIPFDLLRKPRDIRKDGTDEDEGYRAWYQRIKNASHGIKVKQKKLTVANMP